MRFNLWTFIFQVINFFVLLCILRRILFKPIREIIEKRRAFIQKNIDDAERTKKEALELSEHYQRELDKLQALKSVTLEKMQEEVEQERKRLLCKAEEDAHGATDKERALFEAEKKRLESELKVKAIEAVSVFAAKLLKDLSDESLHHVLYSRLLQDIESIASRLAKIKEEGKTPSIELGTAYPLDENEITTFKTKIESSIPGTVCVNVTVDNKLIAGVTVKAYDMMYDASLAGQIEALVSELKGTV